MLKYADLLQGGPAWNRYVLPNEDKKRLDWDLDNPMQSAVDRWEKSFKESIEGKRRAEEAARSNSARGMEEEMRRRQIESLKPAKGIIADMFPGSDHSELVRSCHKSLDKGGRPSIPDSAVPVARSYWKTRLNNEPELAAQMTKDMDNIDRRSTYIGDEFFGNYPLVDDEVLDYALYRRGKQLAQMQKDPTKNAELDNAWLGWNLKVEPRREQVEQREYVSDLPIQYRRFENTI